VSYIFWLTAFLVEEGAGGVMIMLVPMAARGSRGRDKLEAIVVVIGVLMELK